MTKQRKPIDIAALAAVTLPQRDPVAAVVEHPRAAAMREAQPAKPKPQVKPVAEAKPKAQPAVKPTSRAGKVGIQVWTTPDTRKRLRHYATEKDRTLDDLVTEALSDLMQKLKIA